MASLFKKSNVELELISDVDMLLMIEKGIHGGITQTVCHYFRSNNKYMDKKYAKLKNQHIFSIMMLIACMLGQ